MPIDFEKIENKVKKEEESHKINYWKKLLLFFTNPTKFYTLTKEKENSFFPAVWFIIPFVIIFSLGHIGVYQYNYSPGDLIDFILIPFQSFFLFAIISTFLFAYLFIVSYGVHIFLKPLGRKNEFFQTAKGFIYGLPPFILLSWIPFSIESGIFSIQIFQIIGLLWTLVLQVKGLSINQEIKWWKILLIILPLLILDMFILGIFTAT